MRDWPEEQRLGIRNIDAYHRELYRRTFVLLAAVSDPIGRTDLAELLSWVGSFVTDHFADEVSLMAEHQYPGIERHLAAHGEFQREFRLLAQQLTFHGATGELAMKLAQLLCGWLRTHVAVEDRQLAAFVLDHHPAPAEGEDEELVIDLEEEVFGPEDAFTGELRATAISAAA